MSKLREGWTTGACAAAASKAAAITLCLSASPKSVTILLPDGEAVEFPVILAKRLDDGAKAAVRKDAGDDPDVTDGSSVEAIVNWADEGDIQFYAGDGVGTVTKPGLSIAPGEPAINPVPRQMIRDAIREITDRPVSVTVSIPGGRELAKKTFNPQLGIVNGLSILGTSGRVRPFSCEAMRCSLKCSLDIASASGVRNPVFVPGNIGRKAAENHFSLELDQVVQVGNEWGFMIDQAAKYEFEKLLIVGHPGKLAKLAAGQWDTHSSRSPMAAPWLLDFVEKVLGEKPASSNTTEGIFFKMNDEERKMVGDALAVSVCQAVKGRIQKGIEPSVVLINMQGDRIGTAGELEIWK
jgi:cobalt-precorrin-5B (C1)-methyltransferase